MGSIFVILMVQLTLDEVLAKIGARRWKSRWRRRQLHGHANPAVRHFSCRTLARHRIRGLPRQVSLVGDLYLLMFQRL